MDKLESEFHIQTWLLLLLETTAQDIKRTD